MRNTDNNRLINTSKRHKHNTSAYGLDESQDNPNTSYFSYGKHTTEHHKSLKERSVSVQPSRENLLNKVNNMWKNLDQRMNFKAAFTKPRRNLHKSNYSIFVYITLLDAK